MASQKSESNIKLNTFTCPGMDGFTFQYPVPDGWSVRETKLLERFQCQISFESGAKSGKKLQFQVNIGMKLRGEPGNIIAPNDLKKNPNGIPYYFRPEDSHLSFYPDDSKIGAVYMGMTVPQPNGISVKDFFGVVIQNFKVEDGKR